MTLYEIPQEYYFRLHHIRPRFKNDVENVLIYIAEELTKIGSAPKNGFIKLMNSAIYKYPGNAHRELKTINNWRTEISALFGLIEYKKNIYKAGKRAVELAQNQDLVQFFKVFLFNFQYPGAHIKPNSTLEQIQHGIHFKPAQFILKLLKYACNKENSFVGLTKPEICHCIFNDLRVTRDNEDVSKTWERIATNRQNNVTYDQAGDVIRYAGDIVDYMEIADLLKTYDGRTYFLNTLEDETIIKFCESTEWFSCYDDLIKNRQGTLQQVKECVVDWFEYVNRCVETTDFSTDVLSYIAQDREDYIRLQKNASIFEQEKGQTEEILDERIQNDIQEFSTKEIGDIGENLIHGHECMRMKNGGRADLIHLIKRLPTKFALGYDISSVEFDERKRYIEVKTTISSKPLRFNRVHLTKNEWNTANTTRDRYYIYRLMISKREKVLFMLQDPVGLYKSDKIDMVPNNDGADITFDHKKVGEFTELLTWRS